MKKLVSCLVSLVVCLSLCLSILAVNASAESGGTWVSDGPYVTYIAVDDTVPEEYEFPLEDLIPEGKNYSDVESVCVNFYGSKGTFSGDIAVFGADDTSDWGASWIKKEYSFSDKENSVYCELFLSDGLYIYNGKLMFNIYSIEPGSVISARVGIRFKSSIGDDIELETGAVQTVVLEAPEDTTYYDINGVEFPLYARWSDPKRLEGYDSIEVEYTCEDSSKLQNIEVAVLGGTIGWKNAQAQKEQIGKSGKLIIDLSECQDKTFEAINFYVHADPSVYSVGDTFEPSVTVTSAVLKVIPRQILRYSFTSEPVELTLNTNNVFNQSQSMFSKDISVDIPDITYGVSTYKDLYSKYNSIALTDICYNCDSLKLGADQFKVQFTISYIIDDKLYSDYILYPYIITDNICTSNFVPMSHNINISTLADNFDDLYYYDESGIIHPVPDDAIISDVAYRIECYEDVDRIKEMCEGNAFVFHCENCDDTIESCDIIIPEKRQELTLKKDGVWGYDPNNYQPDYYGEPTNGFFEFIPVEVPGITFEMSTYKDLRHMYDQISFTTVDAYKNNSLDLDEQSFTLLPYIVYNDNGDIHFTYWNNAYSNILFSLYKNETCNCKIYDTHDVIPNDAVIKEIGYEIIVEENALNNEKIATMQPGDLLVINETEQPIVNEEYGVTITPTDKALKHGLVLNVSETSVTDEISSKVSGALFAYDIALINGITEIDPDTDLTIEIRIPDSIASVPSSIWLQNADGTFTKLKFTYDADKETISFNADHLGIFVFSEEDAGVIGDLDGNNNVDISDIVTLCRIVSNNGDYDQTGDMDNSEVLDITDIVILCRIVANQ